MCRSVKRKLTPGVEKEEGKKGRCGGEQNNHGKRKTGSNKDIFNFIPHAQLSLVLLFYTVEGRNY